MRVVLDTNVVISGVYFGGLPVSDDPDDDMFLAAALAAHVRLIVSGDRDLLRVSGWQGIEVVTPRQFAERYLGA